MDAGQLFNVDPLESRAAKGHGVVTSMAAGNDVFLLGTSKGWIIRHDFNHGDSQSTFFFLSWFILIQFKWSLIHLINL